MAGRKKANKEGESVKLEEQLARALADYDNLRKRFEREREDFGKIAKATLTARLLPVFDMLEGAQKHLKDSGLAITIDEFTKVLREEGIEKIEVKSGDGFDEELHEVIEVVDGKNKGKIAEVVLSGWKFSDGQVIRPVKAKVYGKPSGKKDELEKEMARGDYM